MFLALWEASPRAVSDAGAGAICIHETSAPPLYPRSLKQTGFHCSNDHVGSERRLLASMLFPFGQHFAAFLDIQGFLMVCPFRCRCSPCWRGLPEIRTTFQIKRNCNAHCVCHCPTMLCHREMLQKHTTGSARRRTACFVPCPREGTTQTCKRRISIDRLMMMIQSITTIHTS